MEEHTLGCVQRSLDIQPPKGRSPSWTASRHRNSLRMPRALLVLLACTIHGFLCEANSTDEQPGDLAQSISAALTTNASVVDLLPSGSTYGLGAAVVSLASGESLTIQGHGASIVADASAAGGLRLAAGSRLKLVNCTIVLPLVSDQPRAGPLAPLQWLVNVSVSGQLELAQVRVILGSCGRLQELQTWACSRVTASVQAPWTSPLVGRGYVGLTTWPGLSVAATDTLLTCGPWAESAAMMLAPDLTLNAAALNSSMAADAAQMQQQLDQLPCAVVRVSTPQALSAGMTELQAQVAEGGTVMLQLARNMSVGADAWPVGGVHVSSNVTLVGPPAAEGTILTSNRLEMVELDMRLNLDWVYLNQGNGTLVLRDLVLSNLPANDDSSFPTSLLVGAIWPVHFNRANASRAMLIMQRVLLVVPSDLFSYLSYWGGLQTSNIPLVRDKATWLQGNVYFAQLIADADDDHLLFTRREGQGTLWLDSALTRRVYGAPQLMTNTSVLALTDDPYTPFPSITPVFKATQLAAYLIAPPTPYLMLMRDITLDAAAVQAAAGAYATTIMSSNTLSTCKPGVNLTVTQPVTVIGRPGPTSIALDLGGCSSTVLMRLPHGSRLLLQRLVLTGLGPAPYDSQLTPPALANFTARLWAFNMTASQVGVRLQNVSMLVSAAEVRVVQDIVGLPPAANASTAQVVASAQLSPQLITQLRPQFGVMDVMSYRQDALVLNGVAYDGIDGSQVIITSTLPDPLAHSNLTAVTGLVLVYEEGSPGGLVQWQKAIIGTFSALGALMLLAAGGYLVFKVVSMQRALEVATEAVKAASIHSSTHMQVRVGDEALSNMGYSRSSKTSRSLPVTGTAMDTGGDHQSTVQRGSATSKHANGHANQEVAAIVSFRSSAPSHGSGNSNKVLAGPAALHHSNTSSNKSKKLEGGLAPADDGVAPHEQLARLIETQRDATGIDMQQVEIEQVVGQGSFGVVYRGKWRSMTVAVKALMFQDAGAAKRVRQRAITEAAINTLLTHENIVNTYAYDLRPVGAPGLPDDKLAAHWKLYIIQEFCDGGSLAQAVDKGTFVDARTGQRNMAHILQVAADIAKGMSYIHERAVIHGDLSAGNIMLRFDPRATSCFRAKVCDFGLSRFLDGASHISNARQGTPGYIAPEVMASALMSRDADVWSYGVLLWEMWYGRPPWRDPAIPRGSFDPQKYTHTLPHGCPAAFQSLVYACLYPHPKARPRFADIVHTLHDMAMQLRSEGATRVWAQLPMDSSQEASIKAAAGAQVPEGRPPSGSPRAAGAALAHQQLQLVQELAGAQEQGGGRMVSIQPIAAAAAAATLAAVDLLAQPTQPLLEGVLPQGEHNTMATSIAGLAGSFSAPAGSTTDAVPMYDLSHPNGGTQNPQWMGQQQAAGQTHPDASLKLQT